MVTAQQTLIQQLQAELAAVSGGTYLWSKRFGSTNYDAGYSIATDSNGDVFVVGEFFETVDFGGGGLLSAGSTDIFVAKYSGATGAHIWSKRFGGTLSDGANSIAVDGSGNIVLTGYFRDTVDFGGVPLTSSGSFDVFLLKLSGTNGNHVWSKRFGGTSSDGVLDVAVDVAGDVVITGDFIGNADFGGLILQSAGGGDIFVAKYSGSNGSHLWSKRFGGTSTDSGQGISTDSNGNVFVTGFFNSSTIDFGGGSLTNAGGNDGYLAKLSASNGNHLWSKRFGGTGHEFGRKVAVDSNNNVLLIGNFTSSTIDFGGGALTNVSTQGYPDIYVVKYNSTGVHQWSKAFGGSSFDAGRDIKVDGSGNPVITGYFYEAANFGGATLNSAGNEDIFVAKYAGNNGTHLWSRRFGSSSSEEPQGLALSSQAEID
ncbi:MAG: SBBP repeat-containing protein [Acidobacteriota bacterium]|nr:SBBP repeat-containing protein [Acidobacteriota bacterium]